MPQSEDNHHFDEQMRKRFEDASFVPPAGIWDRIEDELPPVVPFHRKFKYGVVAAILAFSFMSSYFIYSKYDYAYRLNEFMTENLKESESYGQNETVISGLNLSEMSRFVTLYQNGHIKRNLAAVQKTQLESIESEITSFSNDNTSPENNKEVVQTERISKSTGTNLTTNVHRGPDYPVSKNHFSDKASKKSKRQQKQENRANSKNNSNVPNNEVVNKDNELLNGLMSGDERTQEDSLSIDIVRITEEKIDFEPINLVALEDDEVSLYSFQADKIAQKLKKNHHQNRGLFVGPMVGGHYTAMTKSSREGVNTSRMDHKVSFGTFYGLSAGYIINSRWTVGLEWIYNSGEGQRFGEKKNEVNYNKYIDLDYMKLPIIVKYRQQFLYTGKGVPASFNLIGGMQFSRLRGVNTYVDGEIEPFEINYNHHQWGLIAGFEFDIYPTNKIFFTIGGRASFNADLNTFPSLRGADGMAPFSVQTGIYTKLHYHFTRKKSK